MTKKGMDIKGLANAIKNQSKDKSKPPPVEVEKSLEALPLIPESTLERATEASESVSVSMASPENKTSSVEVIAEKTPKKGNIKGKSKSQPTLKIEDIDEFLFHIKNWKRPLNKSRTTVILDDSLLKFFAKAKVATKVPAVQLVNYIVTYFLKCNPDFVDYVNKVREEDSLENIFKDL